MTQSQPVGAVPPRRKKTAAGKKRVRRRGGVSPFIVMGVIGALIVVGLIAAGSLRVTGDPRPATRTLGDPNAKITLEEYSDFQ